MDYLHGRYDTFPNVPEYAPSPTGSDAASSVKAAGNTAVRSPNFVGNFTAAYRYPMARDA